MVHPFDSFIPADLVNQVLKYLIDQGLARIGDVNGEESHLAHTSGIKPVLCSIK
jgi:hypothetical protein